MSKQNIFDNDTFFLGYQQIRSREGNANDLVEKPAIFKMAPDLKGKRVLDLGCGYGENCWEFLKMGAESVTGIDISEKMLAVAKRKFSHERITFIHMCMEEMASLKGPFDVIFSSLALHYIQEFDKLLEGIGQILVPEGTFLFSQEHPLTTCFLKGKRWIRDEKGNVTGANLMNYAIEGKRDTDWIVEDVMVYHRTFSTIINSLIANGFVIDQTKEPVPDRVVMEKYPEYQKNLHKPDFLIIKCHKKGEKEYGI